jgi:hypothetical protein
MSRQSHAIAGAHTLVHRTNRVGARVDARLAFELVGTGSSDMDYVDPILAARSWLADPKRTRDIPSEVTELASRTVDHAEAHIRELDVVAGQVALDANATGTVDKARLDQLDVMTITLQRYSLQLRAAMAEAATAPELVRTRIERALEASDIGGFEALVSAL